MGSSFVDYVLDQLGASLPGLTARGMFGGHGLYSGGVFFAIAFEDRLYFKTVASSVERYVAAGMETFRPSRGQALRSYYEVPAEVVDDRDSLAAWASAAVAAARS